MMRENESDGEGGWTQPHEYVRPWAPRDEGRDDSEDARAHWPEANATPPPEDGYQDTIAFGTPPSSSSSSGRDGQGSYVQPGYESQSASGQAWYDNQAPDGQTWYGSQGGYGSQSREDSGDPAGHQADGGYGAAGWALPDAPPGRPGRGGGSGRGGRFLVYLTVAALAAGIGAGVTVALNHHSAAPSAGISSNEVPGPHDNAAGSGSSSTSLNRVAVANKVKPGLVDITSTLKYNSETAEGTGMIISSTGLVLTNNHVIDEATKVQATLVDPGNNPSPSYPAQVVGYDATDDVALLQLEGAAGLPTETFGNSSQVSLGTPVLALGNAEGQGGARPAAGIINALNRSIQASDQGSYTTEDLNHMLQTNAQIQQGDSGGALANNAGQVIGMITAANTPTSSQIGSSGGTLGFAIPINSALAIARQIALGQRSATVYIGMPGFLGVEVATSSSSNPQQQAADDAQGSGQAGAGSGSSCETTNQPAAVPANIAPIAAGALILGVLCDTAAASAGMVPGDVITSVAGQPVTTPDSLTTITARYHPNDVVSVIWVSLNGVEHTTRMMLGAGPAR
jgi:S1-C subfamily serine protease